MHAFVFFDFSPSITKVRYLFEIAEECLPMTPIFEICTSSSAFLDNVSEYS